MAKFVQNDNQTSGAYTYKPRTFTPSQPTDPGYLYYIMRTYGGYNPCNQGNMKKGLNQTGKSVLPNCVGYAVGRFNEIIGQKACNYLVGQGNACDFWTSNQISGNLVHSQDPQVGAVMCWKGANGNHAAGHVAIVEEVVSPTHIKISQSGWNMSSRDFDYTDVYKKTAYYGYEDERGQWYVYFGQQVYPDYAFQGFLLNPVVKSGLLYTGAPMSYNAAASLDSARVTYEETVTRASYNHKISTLAGAGYTDVRGTNLLTYPSLVEAPYITVRIAGVTFGSYTKGTVYEGNTKIEKVQYPNFVNSLNVVKVNGSVNKYTIQLVYQVQAGEDPNFMEKVFGRSGYSNIYISYGDMQSPNFIYKEEEALITKVVSNVDFASSKITYTISATSNATKLAQNKHNFERITNKKPSEVLFSLLKNNQYGLRDIFPGLYKGNKFNETLVRSNSLIATDDCSCTIEAKTGIDVISYMNYLVSCMTSLADKGKQIKDSYYFMTLRDDINGDFGGTYFTVRKIDQSGITQSFDTYSVDVGFPGQTPVINFSVQNDNLWSILYNYSDTLEQDDYIYKIDSAGHLYSEYAPNLTRNSQLFKTTESAKSWWTRMTKFPITATLTIKGVVRPVMLMTYIKVNAFFYGQRHIASGLYTVTKHVDDISGNGYRTTLTLLRVAGDDDYISGIDYTVSSETYTRTADGAYITGAAGITTTTNTTSQYGGYSGGGGHGGGAGRESKQKKNPLYDQTTMDTNVLNNTTDGKSIIDTTKAFWQEEKKRASTMVEIAPGYFVSEDELMANTKTNAQKNKISNVDSNADMLKKLAMLDTIDNISTTDSNAEMLKKLAMLDDYDN